MITKIEIDGFKTFTNFKIEFAPLTIIAGANASGKSNLFDAMQLLSRIVDSELRTAFSEQRGDASELFSQYDNGKSAIEMFFAVELLTDKNVKDNFGGVTKLKYTRLRYEIRIGRIESERGHELNIISENLNPMRHDDDKWISNHIAKKAIEKWRPKVKQAKEGLLTLIQKMIELI